MTAVKNKFFKCAGALLKGGVDVEAGVGFFKSFVAANRIIDKFLDRA